MVVGMPKRGCSEGDIAKLANGGGDLRKKKKIAGDLPLTHISANP